MGSVMLEPVIAEKILDAMRQGATREAAAAAGPVSRSTLFAVIRAGRLRPESPEGEFVRKMEDADSAAELTAILTWRTHLAADWRACAEFLARHPSTRDRWRRSPVEFSGPDGGAVSITVEDRAAVLVENFTAFLAGHDAAVAEQDVKPVPATKITKPRRARKRAPTNP
jgi:hypothetical protein